ncbi:hypothetical protein ACFL1B_06040 [Nanoarchaeota archaeon]
MLNHKKGQGLSMNVIIIAAIALLILVILSVLIIRAMKNTDESTGRCYAIDMADCEQDVEGDGCDDSNYFHDRSRDGEAGGCDEDEICCSPLGTGQS